MDDECPGCDERQTRASHFIDHCDRQRGTVSWDEVAEVARHYLEE